MSKPKSQPAPRGNGQSEPSDGAVDSTPEEQAGVAFTPTKIDRSKAPKARIEAKLYEKTESQIVFAVGEANRVVQAPVEIGRDLTLALFGDRQLRISCRTIAGRNQNLVTSELVRAGSQLRLKCTITPKDKVREAYGLILKFLVIELADPAQVYQCVLYEDRVVTKTVDLGPGKDGSPGHSKAFVPIKYPWPGTLSFLVQPGEMKPQRIQFSPDRKPEPIDPRPKNGKKGVHIAFAITQNQKGLSLEVVSETVKKIVTDESEFKQKLEEITRKLQQLRADHAKKKTSDEKKGINTKMTNLKADRTTILSGIDGLTQRIAKTAEALEGYSVQVVDAWGLPIIKFDVDPAKLKEFGQRIRRDAQKAREGGDGK